MAAWRILTSYELLYKWISGFDYFADQLFLRIEESQGGIELHATPETINQILLDLQGQDQDTLIAQYLKSIRLKQLLSLPDTYQPDPAHTQGLSEQNLYLIEIQYAHEKQVSLVCFSPDQYEQLAQLTHPDITLYKVGEFLEMCGMQVQMCELVASSPSMADQVLTVSDAVDEGSPSERNPACLTRQAGSTHQSPGAKASGAAEERSQQHLVTQLRGWLLPTSHRIGSQADGVQILLFMLSSAILTYILRGKVENLTSRGSINPTELALGANELEQFRHLLRMPWAILSGRPFQVNQPETASTQNFADPQLVGVAAKPFTAAPTQPLGESQPLTDWEPLQTGGAPTHSRPKHSSDPIQLQLRDPGGTEPNPPGTTGENRPSKSLQPDQQENLIKTIQQPINFVPAPPDPPQTDPPRRDESPILTAPESPDDSDQPDLPAPIPPDPATPIPFPLPPEFEQPVAPWFDVDETPWKEQPVLPPFSPGHTDDVEPGSVDLTERPPVPTPGLEVPGRPGGDQSRPDNPIPIPTDEPTDSDDSPSSGENPIGRPDDSLNPDGPIDDPADPTPEAPIGKSPVTLDNPLGKTLLPIGLGAQVIIENFGGVGQGITPLPSVIDKVDTLQLAGAGLTAENMLLNQQGTDLIMQFEVEDSPQIIFKNFALDQLDNLTVETEASVTIGNILFEGQTEITDAFDVIDAELNVQQVLRPNTVTFLNASNNITTGYRNSPGSHDVINGMAGDDVLSGLAGDDLLRGGEGNDQLDGGAGDDSLNGGAGDDILQDFAGNNQMIGGRGRDQFILRPGAGTVTICDFQLGEDRLQLMQPTGSLSAQIRGQNTVLLFNDQPFATLQNVQTDLSNLLGR